MKTLLLILGLFLALISIWQHKYPHKAVVELATGIVPEDPQVLADRAGIDLEIYSLARVGQSEEGMSSDRAKIAVMYATKNHSRARRKSITDIVTAGNPERSDYAQANGRYGRQGIHPYCSTIANPTKHTLMLADAVYSGDAADETQGAQYWDNPLAQKALHLANPKKYKSPEEIARLREAKGLRWLSLPGVTTRFWV